MCCDMCTEERTDTHIYTHKKIYIHIKDLNIFYGGLLKQQNCIILKFYIIYNMHLGVFVLLKIYSFSKYLHYHLNTKHM